MKKHCVLVASIAASLMTIAFTVQAQTGTITAQFTDQLGKTTSINISTPVFETNDGFAYWFKHPLGRSRFSYAPKLGFGNGLKTFQIAEIDFYPNKDDQELDLYKYSYSESKNYFALKIQDAGGVWVIGSPVYDYRNKDNNKPLHVHISRFTDTEFEFDFSGKVSYYTGDNGNDVAMGNISGKLHLYRKPGLYGKTETMPGCNCDPNIYLWEYDKVQQNIRSASACEKEFMKKRFNIKKQALQSLIALDYGGNGKLKANELKVTPVISISNKKIANDKKDFTLCDEADTINFMVTINSEKRFFEEGQGFDYIINIMGSPDNDLPAQDATKATSDKIKQLMIAYQNKQISAEELQKQTAELQNSQQIKKENADFKKAASLNSLSIDILVNPQGVNGYIIEGVNNKANTVTQHNIRQAVAEIFSPASQNGDGSWTKDQMTVFVGKFANPVVGGAQNPLKGITAKVNYPLNGNKLSAYGLIVQFKGDKRIIDKAIPLINWDVLKNFIVQ